MAIRFFYAAHRPTSLFGKFAARMVDRFSDLIGASSMKPLPATYRRQQLAAAVDAAKRIRQGGHR